MQSMVERKSAEYQMGYHDGLAVGLHEGTKMLADRAAMETTWTIVLKDGYFQPAPPSPTLATATNRELLEAFVARFGGWFCQSKRGTLLFSGWYKPKKAKATWYKQTSSYPLEMVGNMKNAIDADWQDSLIGPEV